MAETGHSAGEYISHHLQNLTVCKKDGAWVWNECHGNFWALNVDSMFFAIVLGIFLLWFFHRVAKKASIGQPTKTQAAHASAKTFMSLTSAPILLSAALPGLELCLRFALYDRSRLPRLTG